MNIFSKSLASLVLLLSSSAIWAGIADLPVTTLNGRQVYYYEVKSGESIYGLQKKLGIDRATIEAHNPAVKDGLKAGQMLYFPMTLADSRTSAGVVTHSVQKGETLYGICKKYGVTESQVMALNPGLKANNMQIGQNVVVKRDEPAKSAATRERAKAEKQDVDLRSTEPAREAEASMPTPDPQPETYTIKDGETLYHIAHTHGVTTEDILAANPQLSPTYYRGGDVIVIPQAGYASRLATEKAVKAPERETVGGGDDSSTTAVEIAPADVEKQRVIPDAVTMAVIMPFQMYSDKRTKASATSVDFMRGFLIAVDSLKSNNRPVKLYTYDTAANIDTLRAILKRPELRSVQMIVAPGDSAHMAEISRFGADNGIMVMNPFLGYNDDYTTTATMMQATIPRGDFARKAVEGIVKNYSEYTPVILIRHGGPGKETDFVEALKSGFVASGVTPLVITYDDKLTQGNLAPLASVDGKMLFVPVESASKEVTGFLPSLVEYVSTLQDPSRVSLMGYPEWIVFKGDTRKNMENVNTVIYSRFFIDAGGLDTREAADKFQHWYQRPIDNGFPRQGLLGLDMGMFMIRALRANGGDFDYASPYYDGIQNCYHFVKSPGDKGWHNDMMYLINFRPAGVIEKTAL